VRNPLSPASVWYRALGETHPAALGPSPRIEGTRIAMKTFTIVRASAPSEHERLPKHVRGVDTSSPAVEMTSSTSVPPPATAARLYLREVGQDGTWVRARRGPTAHNADNESAGGADAGEEDGGEGEGEAPRADAGA